MAVRTLRRLQGITYWVINDPDEVYRFINSNVRGEWERDNQKDGVDSRRDEWLVSLPRRKWRLRILETSRIRLDPSTIASEVFTTRLEQRSEEMRRNISEYHIAIWPLVIRGEDFELRDGYCRLAALKSLRINKVMSYVGSLGGQNQ
jgi:hypothetical protein